MNPAIYINLLPQAILSVLLCLSDVATAAPLPPSPTPIVIERGVVRPILQNLPAALLSISGTAPTDVYAVGADAQDGRGPYVLHYDGSGWQRLDTGITSGNLWWISVTLIDGDFYMAGDNGAILQFSPATRTFTRQTTPNAAQLYGIWGTVANNLWAVGGNIHDQSAVLWHYDGEHWKDVSGVLPAGEPTRALYKVWGRSATDVYAVGDVGSLLHFDGTSWSLLDSGVTKNTLFTVHGSDSILTAVGGSFLTGIVLEQQAAGSFANRAPAGAPQMNGVFVPPTGDAVAVGFGLSVATRDSSGWTLVVNGSDLRDFHGTWIDPSDGIWAVGGDLSNLNNGILSYSGPLSFDTPTPTETQTAAPIETATPIPQETPTGSATQASSPTLLSVVCAGDCSGSGVVAVSQLIILVDIALGRADPSACSHGIPVGTSVTIALLVQAVNNALDGCAG